MVDSTARYRVEILDVDSAALAGNPLGDPARRELHLVLPDGADPSGPLPLVIVLAGFSGVARSALWDEPWAEGLGRRIERLTREGRLGPMIFALPDAFTRYGGSQYLDSSATGRYEQYLWQDVLAAIRERIAVGRIGLVGKSSGGYGAVVQAMRHPEHVSAIACHSGDMAFEYCYLPDLPKTVRVLGRHGGLGPFLDFFAAAHKKRDARFFDAINVIGMASCYSPDPSEPLGFALPFDEKTGALRPDVWQRWLDNDPVRMIEEPRHQQALAGLKLLFLDAGTRDEYALDIGARIFAERLRACGVPFVHEELNDGHMNLNYRYDVSLPLLWQALR